MNTCTQARPGVLALGTVVNFLLLCAALLLAPACNNGGGGGSTEPPAVVALQGVSPDCAPVEGGVVVTIRGGGFVVGADAAHLVMFGDQAATGVHVLSAQELECIVPAAAAGTVDISITNDIGSATLVDAFHYVAPEDVVDLLTITPNSGPAAGGLQVELAGSGFVLLARWSQPSPPAEGRRGLSPAWPALGAIAAATSVGHWSSAASFHSPDAAPRAAAAKDEKPSPVPTIDLEMRPFEGRPLSESTLAKYLPQLVELCAARDAYIVVYSPYCESCFTLFTGTFGVPRPELVIAVAVPMSDDATSASTEAPRPIECLDCVELSLPKGPNWMVAPPMVLKVESGILTCVADRFGGDCLPK